MRKNVDLQDCFQKNDLDFCKKFNVNFLPMEWQALKEPTSVLCDNCHVSIPPKKTKYFNSEKNLKLCDSCFLDWCEKNE